MTRSFSTVAGARPSALFLMSHWAITQDLVQGRAGATVRASVQAIANITGRDRDIPAPNVYTSDMIMSWMADEYANFRGEPCPGVITGKPIALGGSLDRDDATALGKDRGS